MTLTLDQATQPLNIIQQQRARPQHANFRMNFEPFEKTEMNPGEVPESSKAYPQQQTYDRYISGLKKVLMI